MQPWKIEATGWDVVYPAHVEPIGQVWRRRDGFHARLDREDLGVFDTGDEAVEAVWTRFVDQSAARHAHASVTHGGAERHVHA
jgi:hypothetical protein